jgi:hypothetical protein
MVVYQLQQSLNSRMEMDVAYLKAESWHSPGGKWEHQKTIRVRLISVMSEIRPSMSSIQFISCIKSPTRCTFSYVFILKF